MKSKAARGLFAGVIAGTVAFAFAEAVRPRPGPATLIDWDEIRELALRRLRDDAGLTERRRNELGELYNRLAAEVEAPLLEVVGSLPPETRLPAFQALDRRTWLELNVGILQQALEPALAAAKRLPNSRAVELGRAGLDRYVAFILVFLARRVLGQFDPQLLGHKLIGEEAALGDLYLVEPNIETWERQAALPGEELRRWLILHEATHAWQFAAHPWLRRHLNSMLQEVVRAATGGEQRDTWSQLVAMTVGLPRQWAVVRRMQATMTLIEGYSNLVMNIVGRRLLPSFEQLETAYRKRSGQRSALEVAFWKLTGLDLKLQQYLRGEAFCTAVYQAHGMQALNLAWQSEDTLPRLEELSDPERWYRRVSRVAG